MSLGCTGTVSVLLWVSKRVDWSSLEGRWWGTAGRGCTSQGFGFLEVGRLLVHTWLLKFYLIAYLAPTLSHFLRKKSCISCTFGDHSDVLSARHFQEKQRKISSIRGWWKTNFVVWWSSSLSLFFLLTDSAFFQSARVEISGFTFASRSSSMPSEKYLGVLKKSKTTTKRCGTTENKQSCLESTGNGCKVKGSGAKSSASARLGLSLAVSLKPDLLQAVASFSFHVGLNVLVFSFWCPFQRKTFAIWKSAIRPALGCLISAT